MGKQSEECDGTKPPRPPLAHSRRAVTSQWAKDEDDRSDEGQPIDNGSHLSERVLEGKLRRDG